MAGRVGDQWAELSHRGKTSGPSISFFHPDCEEIRMHKPHPGNELKPYQKREIITKLRESGLI